MKWFIRMNFTSIIFAFPLFISLELLLNVYRIGRVTGWDLEKVIRIIHIYNFVGFIISTIIFLYIVNKWMEGRTARYWTIPLSIFHLFMFIFIFSSLFPITYPGDKPNPVSGLIVIALMILYPFYLFFINLFVNSKAALR